MNPIRLLIVDDSAYNRRHVADMFANVPEVEVVGKAADGEDALRLASLLKPDLITLDLEMPRMDGFTFLRILMAKRPTPVIVVSSYAQRENVFKALELGALDFVAKPEHQVSPDSTELRESILAKVLQFRNQRPAPARPLAHGTPSGVFESAPAPAARTRTVFPRRVVGIVSSTGGPSALLEIFGHLPAATPATFLMAQHMPDKFTRTFAERLGRRGPVRVTEAQDGDRPGAGMGFVCPGRRCMELEQNGAEYHLRVVHAASEDRYVPSGDRLLQSVARVAGARGIGVILTGMGNDGVEGAKAIVAAGGEIIIESQETAVVYGMPGACKRAGVPARELPLPEIGDRLGALT